jgi:hypothetical protein
VHVLSGDSGLSAVAARMALVTIDAVVDVTLHASVLSVRVGFRVAVGALEHGVVIRIRMAC